MRIKNKLILQSVVLLGSALGGADIFFYISERNHLLAEEASAQGAAAMKFSNVSAECILSGNDFFLLNYTKAAMERSPGLLWAAVLDPGGKYLFHSDLTRGDAGLIGKSASGSWADYAVKASSASFRDTESGAGKARLWFYPVASQKKILAVAVLAYDRTMLEHKLSAILSAGHKRFLWIAAAVLLLGITASVFLAVYFTLPVRKLSEGAAAIGEGNWDFRIELGRRNDELGLLAGEFNEMAARLKELDELKNGLIHHVSHEIRNPLGAIDGYLKLFSRSCAGMSREQEDYVRIMRSNLARLNSLVDDILLLAALEAGRIRYDFRPCPLSETVRSVAELFAASTLEKNITLDWDVPKELTVRMDPERIRQVLVNLTANAVKYTPGGGGIRLGAQAWNELSQVRVFVMDTGPGIPPEKIQTLFRKLSRADDVRTRGKVKGTGLGLYISRQIVEAHGGAIWAESAPGEGSVFSFTLPAAAPEPPEAALDA